MFKGKLEAGDRAVFMNETECFADRTMTPCTVRFVDSHTTTVVFDDGFRLCVYPGELVPLVSIPTHKEVRIVRKHPAMAAPYGAEPLRPCRSPYCECAQGACTHPGCYDARSEPWEPYETIGRFQYPLTEDEGSLA